MILTKSTYERFTGGLGSIAIARLALLIVIAGLLIAALR